MPILVIGDLKPIAPVSPRRGAGREPPLVLLSGQVLVPVALGKRGEVLAIAPKELTPRSSRRAKGERVTPVRQPQLWDVCSRVVYFTNET